MMMVLGTTVETVAEELEPTDTVTFEPGSAETKLDGGDAVFLLRTAAEAIEGVVRVHPAMRRELDEMEAMLANEEETTLLETTTEGALVQEATVDELQGLTTIPPETMAQQGLANGAAGLAMVLVPLQTTTGLTISIVPEGGAGGVPEVTTMVAIVMEGAGLAMEGVADLPDAVPRSTEGLENELALERTEVQVGRARPMQARRVLQTGGPAIGAVEETGGLKQGAEPFLGETRRARESPKESLVSDAPELVLAGEGIVQVRTDVGDQAVDTLGPSTQTVLPIQRA